MIWYILYANVFFYSKKILFNLNEKRSLLRAKSNPYICILIFKNVIKDIPNATSNNLLMYCYSKTTFSQSIKGPHERHNKNISRRNVSCSGDSIR